MFLAQTLYIVVNSNRLQSTFLRFLTALVKICQIPQVNFELTSQFLFNFCIIFHCHYTYLPCTFLAYAFYTLDKRIPWKSQFWDFKCSGENLQNSSCCFLNHKSRFRWIVHHTLVSCKMTLLYIFKLNVMYFAQKGSIKMQNFETFEWLDHNSANSCHFGTANCLSFKFTITPQCHERYLLSTF